MSPDSAIPYHPPVLAAVEKFYQTNDDLAAVQATTRRVFFEFLRTKPALTKAEIETLWTVADLLGEICTAKVH